MKPTPRAAWPAVLPFLLAALLSSAACAQEPPAADDRGTAPDVSGVERLVAVGDVHGDLDAFVEVLTRARLIDAERRWAGGEAVLVQTGDILDRGPSSRQVLDLLRRLEGEAESAGGRVIAMIGNHEVFNVVNDLRYLHPRELDPYAREEDPAARKRQIEAVREFIAKPKPRVRSRYYELLARDLERSGYETRFPPGYFRHRELFAAEGLYGKWVLSRPAIVKIDRTLFLHGGLHPVSGRTPFRVLRERFTRELAEHLAVVAELVRLEVFHPALDFGELYQLRAAEAASGGIHPEVAPLLARLAALDDGVLFGVDGIVWYRGLAQASEATLRVPLRGLLAAQDADRIVIGHTQPADLHVEMRVDGRVILIDTGMNHEVYRGFPEALEITGGDVLRVLGRDAARR